MALYKVDSDTADLTKVAGGTLYADLPISSWVKQANQISFYIYNRTSSAWPANTYTNIQVEF